MGDKARALEDWGNGRETFQGYNAEMFSSWDSGLMKHMTAQLF